MDFSPQPEHIFYRRLNPTIHVKAVGDTYRVTSAAFKDGEADGHWVNSVDWGEIVSLDEERLLRDHEHPGHGIGSLPFSSIRPVADVYHEPLPTNEAHCNLTLETSQQKARALAKASQIEELPARLS